MGGPVELDGKMDGTDAERDLCSCCRRQTREPVSKVGGRFYVIAVSFISCTHQEACVISVDTFVRSTLCTWRVQFRGEDRRLCRWAGDAKPRRG